MLDVMATHITIAGLSSSLCEHQLATKLSFYHLLAHIVGVSFTRPPELFPNNHGSLGHADVQPWQNKHRNYYRPLKITPSEHKCSLYTVETAHASLAPWTGSKSRFPVVCDHMVRGPRCFQLSNQTKQLLKANVRNTLREESFRVHLSACHFPEVFSMLSLASWREAATGRKECPSGGKAWRCLSGSNTLLNFTDWLPTSVLRCTVHINKYRVHHVLAATLLSKLLFSAKPYCVRLKLANGFRSFFQV